MSPQRIARDPWLDNAKMALVTLVVIGHAWALLPADGVLGHLYDFLYAWHMPAFVFVKEDGTSRLVFEGGVDSVDEIVALVEEHVGVDLERGAR